MQTTGYHTLEDRNNADQVEKNGPFISDNKKCWLGNGYYFWDNDLERAHEWGKNYPLNGYMICQADLHLDDDLLLDLCTDEGKRAMGTLIKVLQNDYKSGYENKHRSLGATITHLIKISKWPQYRDVFPFKFARAQDFPNDTLIRFSDGGNETTSLNPRTQICLFEKSNLVLRSFCIIYPLEYKQD